MRHAARPASILPCGLSGCCRWCWCGLGPRNPTGSLCWRACANAPACGGVMFDWMLPRGLELAQPLWLFLLLPVAGGSWLAWRRAQGEVPGMILNHPALPLAAVGRLPAPSLRGSVALRGLAFALLVLALAQPRQVGGRVQAPPPPRGGAAAWRGLAAALRGRALAPPRLGGGPPPPPPEGRDIVLLIDTS